MGMHPRQRNAAQHDDDRAGLRRYQMAGGGQDQHRPQRGFAKDAAARAGCEWLPVGLGTQIQCRQCGGDELGRGVRRANRCEPSRLGARIIAIAFAAAAVAGEIDAQRDAIEPAMQQRLVLMDGLNSPRS